jgi:transcriptional regulator with XRE-family HTH domain
MKRFKALRGAMIAKGIDQRYLAELLGRGECYISHRMTGKAEWSMNEMYQIMDILDMPYERLHEMFPKDGISNEVHEYKRRMAL